MRILMLMSLLSMVCNSQAAIFKCVGMDGSVYYQETFCNEDEEQTQLLCKTKPFSKKAVQQSQRRLQVQRRYVLQNYKLLQREERARDKQDMLDVRRKERLKAKCQKIEQKIVAVNEQLHSGYTIKQGQSLNRKLAKYQEQKQRNCTDE